MDLPLRKASFKTQLPGFCVRQLQRHDVYVFYLLVGSITEQSCHSNKKLSGDTETSRLTDEDSSGAQKCLRAEEEAQGLPNHGENLQRTADVFFNPQSINESP